jgi:ribosome maturation protein SDO1
MGSRGGIKTPTNQKILTNIAVVKMKKCGKRFELACYKNKVVSWRDGIEKDIDEVLQSDQIFVNVSKGEVAKKADLLKCFEEVKGDQKEICKIILAKGDLQVSDKERQAQQDAMFKDIATVISDKCVNPESKRPYPVSMIEKAMKECHVAVKPNKSSKQQALETIGKLKETLPIERAQMRMKVITPIRFNNKIRKQLTKLGSDCTVESEDKIDDTMALVILVDPGQYRTIDDLVRNETQGGGSMELISLKEIRDGEEKIE